MDEREVQRLKEAIVAKLLKLGGDPARRLQRHGYDYIRIVSNEQEGGSSALMLHVNGGWSMKYDMMGCPLTNPSLDELLLECASIKAKDFWMLEDEEQEKYVQEHRVELLTGLIESMKEVLSGL